MGGVGDAGEDGVIIGDDFNFAVGVGETRGSASGKNPCIVDGVVKR